MKLTTLALFITMMQASAIGFAQQITLKQRNVTIGSVFDEIKKQTGYDVFYLPSALNPHKKIDANFEKTALREVMNACLQNQQATYTIDEKTIVITRKKAESANNPVEKHLTIDINGKIINDKGEPLSGVNILIQDKNARAITNSQGEFSIKNADEGDLLIISYLGYQKKEVVARAEMESIILSQSDSKLDEVQVIAYGNTTRRFNTGSSNQVSGVSIERQPQSNPVLNLQGQVPGLFITANSGYPGSQINVNIRGQNSLNSLTTQPLYIIDGVPFDSKQVEQSVGGFMAQVGFSPLNTINPENIESISVLKDADATAIYGSRGAAGVILITTKKGHVGNTQVTVDLSHGNGRVTNLVKMASVEQYLNIRRQAFENDGVTPTATNAPDLLSWPTDMDTDFGELIAGETAQMTNAALSASGGNSQTQFRLGANIRSQSSIYQSRTKDNAQQFNLSVQHKSADARFGMDASVNYNLDNNTIPNYTINYLNYSLPPNYPLYDDNGGLHFAPSYTNPLAAFNIINNLESENFIANASFHYTVLPGLEIKANAGYNKIEVNGAIITPSSALNPTSNNLQTSTLNNNYIQTYLVEPQLDFNRTWGKHNLLALVGGTWQQTQTVQPYYVYGSFSTIELARSLNAIDLFVKTSAGNDYKYVSGFSKVSYRYADKYLINANFRRDGSSRFGENRKFGNFGSLGAAWIFSEEEFIKQTIPWLSFGKLRGSYGSIGSDRIQDYLYDAFYMAGQPYGPTTGYAPSRVANPYLQWEVTKKADLSLDLGFVDNRVLFTTNLYRNRSNHLLGTIRIPSQTGFSSYTANLPATVQNQGIEFELSTVNVQKSDLKWSTSINLTLPQNKLIDFPNIDNTYYTSQYVVGQSLNYVPLYQFTGFVDGIATVADTNQDGVISSGLNAYGLGDRTGSANRDPKLYGGISNTITYKGFQIDILIQGTVRDETRGDLGLATRPGMGYNVPESMLDIPVRYTATTGTPSSNAWQYYIGSDEAWESAAYLRLRNLSIAYNFKTDWLKKIKMNALQVYLRGQNLVTLTGYKGLDPETLNALPPMKVILIGLRTTL
ncbi:SusC/RagA family TonB-linked outer membrane protein [Olivibacter sp. XZL3]|uniref:SusC/RagA family TonB-linked outer membrane protein n=1 Tax=Olivibacter sp. XZL3 TaxID=1735116 RepID=UPI001416F142|nr:SusC/RagA family TonB-linked outer membrane protein [Olivibacter sp. XZL3]